MNDGTSIDADIQSGMFDAACDLLGVGAFIYDRNDCLVFASRQMHRFLPISPDVLRPGARLRDVLGAVFDAGIRYGIPAEQRHRVVNREEWISARISAHWREQHEMVERLGKDRWVRFRKRRLPNGYNISTLTDVSEQRKQEEQWRADLKRVALTEHVLDTLPHPLIIKDRNLVYLAVNKAFCAIHGVESEAILGHTVWDLVDAENAMRIDASDRGVLETGIPSRSEEHIVGTDGSHLYVVTRKYRIGTPDNSFLVTLMDDVTHIVDPKEELAANRFTLRVTTQFVKAENCFDPAREAETRLLLQQWCQDDEADVAGKRILLVTPTRRTEELLIGELQARGADCCAVRSLAEFNTFLDVANSCGVGLDLILLDDTMDGFEAIAEAGGVPVRVITPDRIGVDFFRALVEPHAVVAEAMPIDVVAPSALFDDWYIATDADSMSPIVEGDIEVLVAEDNQINQFVFSQILEGMGVSHRIAENGEEAVALWRKHQPRLVLMDIAMPVMNGLDATLEIREAEKALQTRTPIVAVTAQALNVDMQNCLDAGMDDYITKPVSPDMIESIYKRFVTQKRAQNAA
ncbi:PAS domain S-box-containing protein [Mycoplana sp. BE70]|uniref:response regulator n=1 Tax=Mycoplana sp. BE70 TaxID=2817775 RepID=UPI002860CFE6|nr:response regulator [Mycoplana sp. BE70]MDR6756224.1 PAS domain S-box-containing protein [Mycoplana sp. BE70]